MRSSKTSDGKRSWLSALGRSLPVKASRAAAVSGVEDVEDANWRLNETAGRFRELLDTQSNLIVQLDADGLVVFANRPCLALFGDALIGAAFAPTIIAVEARETDGDSDAAKAERIELMQTVMGERWFSWTEEALPAVPPEVPQRLLTGRDVTSERAIRLALREARDDAEAASRAKSRFLAGMSHEIRTPMNGIMGMSALLADTPLNAEQRTYLDAVTTSARTLLALVNDILDFSKIEAGKLELQQRTFDLRDCVQSAVELLAPKASEKGIELVWRVEPSIPSLVQGDDMRLRQIMLNLLSNAVKFTDRGGVDLRVTRGDAGGQAHTSELPLIVSVEDTGIGLTQEQIERLFVEFEQAQDPAQHRGGTGLGLAISDRLAKAMGGAMSVESTAGKGSRFSARVVLPAAYETGPSEQAVPAQRQVLIACDGPMQRRVLAEVIEHAGSRTIVSDLARSKTAVAQSAATGHDVDAVIVSSDSDPVTCGEVLAAVRAAKADARGLVLIPASGRAILQDFRAQGFDRYLITPVRPNSLLEQLGVTASPGLSETLSVYAPAVPARQLAKGGRVLIAEDNEINALLARRLIERLGWSYRHVTNGAAAVETIARSIAGQEAPFDAILMDVFMPEMNGLEATKAIKAMARDNLVPPIIALTANAFAEDKAACFAAGMDGFLTKPFDLAALEAVLQRHVEQTPRRGGAQHTTPAA